MGAHQAFIEVGFQGRLRHASALLRAEVLLFKVLLEDYGLDAATVPAYSVTGAISLDTSGQEMSREVELKLLGVWTWIVVETRAPNVFVVHDRRP